MARPREEGLRYFPMDVHEDDQLKALQELHGNDGFTWINKFWKSAYKKDSGIVDMSCLSFEVIGAKTSRISVDKQSEIIRDCILLRLLYEVEPKKYTSHGIQERLKKIQEEREKDRNYSKNKLSERKLSDNAPKTGESKRKHKQKVKEIFIAPSFEEWEKYCDENGFKNIAERSFKGYQAANWHDTQGNPIRNWKQKLQNVWFSEKNKLGQISDSPKKTAREVQLSVQFPEPDRPLPILDLSGGTDE